MPFSRLPLRKTVGIVFDTAKSNRVRRLLFYTAFPNSDSGERPQASGLPNRNRQGTHTKKIDPGTNAGVLQKVSTTFLMLLKVYQSQQQPSTILHKQENADFLRSCSPFPIRLFRAGDDEVLTSSPTETSPYRFFSILRDTSIPSWKQWL